jgi:gamma-tubulin complex component 4
MIAEILLILAGHSPDSLFKDQVIQPTFASLLHPGEKQCLESLGLTASRYRKIKSSCQTLSNSPSRYIRALCATLDTILKDEYENLVVSTETKVLRKDSDLVASGSFVPLSAIRTIFAPWDTPFSALVALFNELEAQEEWTPGTLIDMLLYRSRTGVHRIADILSKLCVAVQRVWRTQLLAFIVHGTLSKLDPLASKSFILLPGSMPTCVSSQSQDSITYIGRAIATVKGVKTQSQPPRTLASEHTRLLETVLPEDQHAFDVVIQQIRVDISEWLWNNVLTRKMVEDAVDSL